MITSRKGMRNNFIKLIKMATINENAKRDFITQLIVLMEQNAALLTNQGFDPAPKVATLKQLKTEAETDEANQQDAMSKAKDATAKAKQSLGVAYKAASEAVELMAGLLGKNNNLILEIRKMRK